MLNYFLYRVYNFLFTLTHPRYWGLFETAQSKNVDELVRKLIESGAPVKYVNEYRTKVGEFEFWTSNYPYAYGGLTSNIDSIPFALTRRKLRDYIEKQLISQGGNHEQN